MSAKLKGRHDFIFYYDVCEHKCPKSVGNGEIIPYYKWSSNRITSLNVIKESRRTLYKAVDAILSHKCDCPNTFILNISPDQIAVSKFYAPYHSYEYKRMRTVHTKNEFSEYLREEMHDLWLYNSDVAAFISRLYPSGETYIDGHTIRDVVKAMDKEIGEFSGDETSDMEHFHTFNNLVRNGYGMNKNCVVVITGN